MARYIDADALVSALNNGRLKEQTGRAVPFNAGVAFALTMVEYAPTIDAVPVVRCKDCVYGTDRTEDFQEEDERWDVVNPIDCMMYSSDGIPDFFPKDNYCGFGERRDDEID